jgi:hypothetical protein
MGGRTSARWPGGLGAVVAAWLAAGCAVDRPGDEEPACVEDECESVGSREELLAALDGHGDPVAAYLRQAATARGTLTGDFRAVFDGVGDELGCDAASETSFVVLSNLDFVPKTVVTRCADEPQAASRFFAAVPALRAHGGALDVDPQNLHLAAWDDAAATYRTYSTRPDASGEMAVNVSPQFCLGCHGGPHRTGFWQPLMNEMSNPWSGWNAEPGFRSQLFDEWLDPEVASGEVFGRLTAGDLLDSASELEPIVRAGIDRVTGARLASRKTAVDPEAALALLRPLFCDETINFVSESHGSGELRSSALVDRAIPALFAALGQAQPWAADTVRLPATDPADGLTLMPVRGESTLAIELGLVGRQAVAAADVLRIRALDHGRPVLSDFRCGLWQAGAERVRAGALHATIAGLPADATTADLLAPMLAELMTLERDGARLRLSPPPGADAIAFVAADDPAVAAALASGDLAALAIDFATLGQRLGGQLAADRAALFDIRAARACDALDRYAVAPIYPDLACE